MEIDVWCDPCVVCKQRAVVRVRRDGWLLWKAGVLIQDAMPDLDVGKRELLINGTHEHCWVTLEEPEDG